MWKFSRLVVFFVCLSGSHCDVLRHVVDAFFEVYAKEELHPKVAKLALSLKTAVAKELIVQNQLSQTIGALESIMNVAWTSTLQLRASKGLLTSLKKDRNILRKGVATLMFFLVSQRLDPYLSAQAVV